MKVNFHFVLTLLTQDLFVLTFLTQDFSLVRPWLPPELTAELTSALTFPLN
jgi:hypothetical protein